MGFVEVLAKPVVRYERPWVVLDDLLEAIEQEKPDVLDVLRSKGGKYYRLEKRLDYVTQNIDSILKEEDDARLLEIYQNYVGVIFRAKSFKPTTANVGALIKLKQKVKESFGEGLAEDIYQAHGNTKKILRASLQRGTKNEEVSDLISTYLGNKNYRLWDKGNRKGSKLYGSRLQKMASILNKKLKLRELSVEEKYRLGLLYDEIGNRRNRTLKNLYKDDIIVRRYVDGNITDTLKEIIDRDESTVRLTERMKERWERKKGVYLGVARMAAVFASFVMVSGAARELQNALLVEPVRPQVIRPCPEKYPVKLELASLSEPLFKPAAFTKIKMPKNKDYFLTNEEREKLYNVFDSVVRGRTPGYLKRLEKERCAEAMILTFLNSIGLEKTERIFEGGDHTWNMFTKLVEKEKVVYVRGNKTLDKWAKGEYPLLDKKLSYSLVFFDVYSSNHSGKARKASRRAGIEEKATHIALFIDGSIMHNLGKGTKTNKLKKFVEKGRVVGIVPLTEEAWSAVIQAYAGTLEEEKEDKLTKVNGPMLHNLTLGDL